MRKPWRQERRPETRRDADLAVPGAADPAVRPRRHAVSPDDLDRTLLPILDRALSRLPLSGT